jgi:hypothetical protein
MSDILSSLETLLPPVRPGQALQVQFVDFPFEVLHEQAGFPFLQIGHVLVLLVVSPDNLARLVELPAPVAADLSSVRRCLPGINAGTPLLTGSWVIR